MKFGTINENGKSQVVVRINEEYACKLSELEELIGCTVSQNIIELICSIEKDKIADVISAAKNNNCSIRIGVNSGSLEKDILEKYKEPCPEALVESAIRNIKILEDEDFYNLKEHRIIYESLVSLTLHEVGHTLGLNHNFFSSNLHNLKNIHDRHITEPTGLVSSVMDYVPSNISPDKKHQGQFYTTTPGPYDIWAIQFGYEQEMLNPQDEKERQEVLLEKSTNRELMFGNDSDDMRSPGKGIDPRIMIGELSSDTMGYAKERMEIIKKTIPKNITKT